MAVRSDLNVRDQHRASSKSSDEVGETLTGLAELPSGVYAIGTLRDDAVTHIKPSVFAVLETEVCRRQGASVKDRFWPHPAGRFSTMDCELSRQTVSDIANPVCGTHA